MDGSVRPKGPSVRLAVAVIAAGVALAVVPAVKLAPDPDKMLLPKFAARYKTPVEMLDIPGERVIATLTAVHVVATG